MRKDPAIGRTVGGRRLYSTRAG